MTHFETHVERGPSEREWPVDAAYQIDASGKVVLTHWAISDETYPLTERELEDIETVAREIAAEDTADIELTMSRASESVWLVGRAA